MNYYPTSIRNLIRQIAKLPGIGEKTAERLALYILRAPRHAIDQLTESIIEVKQRTRTCRRCLPGAMMRSATFAAIRRVR